jgi:hypothetical protein
MKKWKGTAFNADGKFVLRLKHLRTRVRKTLFGDDETVHDYNVTITKAGSNSPSSCANYPEQHVTVNEYSPLICVGGDDLQEYRFSLKTNRFLSTYLYGYIDGKDSKENTPSIEGGTCTKID